MSDSGWTVAHGKKLKALREANRWSLFELAKRTDIEPGTLAGVPVRTLMELGGWSTLSMVEIYAHAAEGHKVEAVRRLDAYSGTEILTKFGLERESASGVS